MFKKILLLLSVTVFFTGAGDGSFKVPIPAFKILIDSENDECATCRKELRAEAVSMLNSEFTPGRVISGKRGCRFIKTDLCSGNEFILSCYTNKEKYEAEGKNKITELPMLIFRYHTEEDHLVGIYKNDFTARKIAGRINNIRNGKEFSGRIRIIFYEYGDGNTFNYFGKRNAVLVHCSVETLD